MNRWKNFRCHALNLTSIFDDGYTDKKENKIFLTYKEFQMGAVAKSYMRKGFLINEEISHL
jgi:hypothetical protein